MTVLLLWFLAGTIGVMHHSTLPQELAGVAAVLWVGFYYASRMAAKESKG